MILRYEFCAEKKLCCVSYDHAHFNVSQRHVMTHSLLLYDVPLKKLKKKEMPGVRGLTSWRTEFLANLTDRKSNKGFHFCTLIAAVCVRCTTATVGMKRREQDGEKQNAIKSCCLDPKCHANIPDGAQGGADAGS